MADEPDKLDEAPLLVVDQPSAAHALPRHSACIEHARRCDERWDLHNEALKAVEAAMLEHKLRLENGTRVFTDIKSEIAAVRTDIKEVAKATHPKPVNWLPIIGLGITVLALVLGSWWALSEKLSARPTTGEVREAVKTHTDQGHPEMRQIREEQIEQRQEIKNVKQTVEATRSDVQDIKSDIRAMRDGKEN